MPLKIVRNDIAKMNVDVIVNTASADISIGPGCDYAVYNAAGADELLAYRRDKIGFRKEGDIFVTPGFNLPAKYIIHAVSPLYKDGNSGEEELLRNCYGKALRKFAELVSGDDAEMAGHTPSIAFPLISTGNFYYPKEEGMRIALDEINKFYLDYGKDNYGKDNYLKDNYLKDNYSKEKPDINIYLVVYDEESCELGRRVTPDLKEYINRNYVNENSFCEKVTVTYARENCRPKADETEIKKNTLFGRVAGTFGKRNEKRRESFSVENIRAEAPRALPKAAKDEPFEEACCSTAAPFSLDSEEDFDELKKRLDERKKHLADSFSEYLLFLIEQKGMTNAEVYKRAIVDKKLFAKIKNDAAYHPQKLTCLCLCVGAKLNIDETKDLLARAGYALSPCDMRDIIFSYFIENGIYDMVELDIQLEEYDLPPIIA